MTGHDEYQNLAPLYALDALDAPRAGELRVPPGLGLRGVPGVRSRSAQGF